jgi:hypothetical protein
MKPKSVPGQLSLPLYPIKVLVRRQISTHNVLRELQAKVSKKPEQTSLSEKFKRSSQVNKSYSLPTAEGVWSVHFQGQTSTGRKMWNLYFSPKSIVERLVS